MSESPASAPGVKRDWWVTVGMTVTATAAAVSSFSGLRELAVATGWAELLSPLLPLTIDAYAMTATRVWLAQGMASRAARRFARWNAIGAIGLSLVGNAVWHLIAAEVISVTWLIIVLVGAVPPAVLGLLSHLAVLRTHVEAVPGTVPGTGRHEPGRNQAASRSDEELLIAARAADTAHHQQKGRPISRDGLRETLRIGGPRATDILRQLKAERSEAAP
jgi:hypothetical protein